MSLFLFQIPWSKNGYGITLAQGRLSTVVGSVEEGSPAQVGGAERPVGGAERPVGGAERPVGGAKWVWLTDHVLVLCVCRWKV